MTDLLDLTSDVEVMTIRQAAAHIGITKQAIAWLIRAGHLRAAQHEGRWWVSSDDVHAYAASRTRGCGWKARGSSTPRSVPSPSGIGTAISGG